MRDLYRATTRAVRQSNRLGWLCAFGSCRFSCPRDRTAESRLAAFELPRKDAERNALVVQFFQPHVAAEILNVNAVVREERVMRQLISRFREEFVDLVLAELGFRLRSHLLPVF